MGFGDLLANNLIVKLLRGDTGRYDLIVSMVGTRLGDRLLVVGGGDGQLVASLGGPTGLTGRICAVESDPAQAERVARAATAGGVLAEVETSGYAQLPYDAESFDVAVAPVSKPNSLPGAIADVRRLLRSGGRLIVLHKAAPGAAASTLAVFQQAGFRAARLIAERDGLAFFEAVKLN